MTDLIIVLHCRLRPVAVTLRCRAKHQIKRAAQVESSRGQSMNYPAMAVSLAN